MSEWPPCSPVVRIAHTSLFLEFSKRIASQGAHLRSSLESLSTRIEVHGLPFDRLLWLSLLPSEAEAILHRTNDRVNE